jgi:hypothetical protein
MAGTYIGKYDTTAGSNSTTASNAVSVAEGMLPSNINNALRDIMADVRQWYNTAEWIEYGDGAGTYTPAYASSTSFTIAAADVTSVYHVGRRVKVVASTPGTIYGSITATAFSTNTTVTVAWDSGSLSNESITSVHIGVISAINTATPESLTITGDYTLDVSGDIILDADGDNVTLKAAGTTSLDFVLNGATNVTLDTPGDLILDAGGADVLLKDDGTTFGSLTQSGGELLIKSGSTPTTALTMAGSSLTVAGNEIITGLTASRALTANSSKQLTSSAVTDTELGYLDGVTSAIQTQLGTKASTTDMNNAIAGLRTRIVVEAASTGNVTISSGLENGDTIDGVTLATGDEVLLKDQSTDSQNGVYTVVSSGTASRATEYDAIAEISGQIVVVNQGTANDNTLWLCTTNSSATLGSDSISFTKITPQNVGDVTLTGTQTLTNKTLTAPILSGSASSAGLIQFKEDTDNGTNAVTLIGPAATADVTVTLPAAADTLVGKATTDTLTNKTLTAPKFASGGFIADANGLEALVFGATGTAVNELKITNAATGSGPTLSSVSSSSTDTNIDINITPAGTGDVVLAGDTVKVGDSGAAATLTSNGAGTLTVTTGGTTDLILNTNSGTNSGTVTITDAANGAITLAPNGTGVVDIQSSMNPSLSSTGKSLVMGF